MRMIRCGTTSACITNAQVKFARLLAAYHPAEWVSARLSQTESRNIEHFGYGIKSFALSMIETAVELTEGRICGPDVQAIIDLAKEMLNTQVELLPYVLETIPALAERYHLMVISKGDLLDQETKIAARAWAIIFRRLKSSARRTGPATNACSGATPSSRAVF